MREVMVASLPGHALETVTPGRGKELVEHALFTAQTVAECRSCPPRHPPRRRGGNENTNGLLRERFLKGRPLDAVTQGEARATCDEPNRKPRKR